MKKTLKTLLSLSLLLSATAFASENKFFDGYTKACNQTAEYVKFQKDLCKTVIGKDGAMSCQKGTLSLPLDIKGSISKVKNNPDNTVFEITLEQGTTFAGNHVVGLEQWSGHENGIWGSALVVEAKTIQEAQKNIKASGVILKKQKSEIGTLGAEVVKGADGKIRIMCDTSN